MTIATLGPSETLAVLACLRRFLQHLFFELFQEFAPPWICRVRRLAFLPHALAEPHCHISWRSLTYDDVAPFLRRRFDVFSRSFRLRVNSLPPVTRHGLLSPVRWLTPCCSIACFLASSLR